MKMEGVSDLVNGRNEVSKPREVSKPVQPSPREIGREFVRQYYTMLSERPQDVYRFYSHESYFVHDTEQPVQGQQKIQRAIERLAFVNCKARIHTVTGTNTMNNGLVIQVCGELTVGDVPQRRFLQTFILCPQTPKKYYVLNDVFQWLDRAFGDPTPGQQPQDAVSFGSSLKEDSPGVVNGEQVPNLNGQIQNVMSSSGDEEQRATDISDETIPVSEEEHDEVEITNEHEQYTAQEEEEHQRIVNTEKQNEAPEEKHAAASLEQEQSVAQSPQQTWAKMVSSSASQVAPSYGRAPMTSQPANRPAVPPAQPTTNNVHPVQSNATNYRQKGGDSYSGSNIHENRYQGETNCKLFIGNIQRSKIPDKAEDAEAEIKSVFEKYGPVTSVRVPQKAVDKTTGNPAFAFIVMTNADGAKKVFEAARKQEQERESYLLRMKLESFAFEGDVTLSQQKNPSMRAQYMHRNGPMPGLGRGSHPRSGMGQRGSGRGMYNRQFGGGSEYRQSGNVHPQQHE